MPRFPKARRKSKSVTVFEQAHHFYGQAFEVTSTRGLADSMAEWADLAAPERTFTMSHLLYLNLMAQAGTHLLLRKVWESIEDLVDELEDQADDRGDGDGEPDADDLEDDDGDDQGDDADDDGDEPEVPDLDDDREPDDDTAVPPGVTIPAAVTPPVDDDEYDDEIDDQDDGPEPDDLDEGDEG